MPLKKKKPAQKKAAPKKKIVKKKPAKKIVKKAVKKAPKKAVKKAAKKPAKKKIPAIGIVTHYFPHVRAAVIKLKAPLKAGDRIRIQGHTTDFTQVVTSMQVDHATVSSAKIGAEIGLEVNSRVREHDVVTKA